MKYDLGLIPMSAKPFHNGHYYLVQKAAAECHMVKLFIGTGNRTKGAGKVITGDQMLHLWKEVYEPLMPNSGSIQFVYEGVPVRNVYETLDYIKEENLENDKNRVVLALKPHLSPIKAAVIPIKKNDSTIVSFSKEIKNNLQKLGLGRVVLENTGNIGKSYRKHDEIGTPVCITIDFDTLEDETVTIRDRDTMEQKRVKVESLNEIFINLLQQ